VYPDIGGYRLVITLEKFRKHVESGELEGKKVITTNGCFDILHAGHAFLLQQAKLMGDVLVVGLNSDSSVRKVKGYAHPIIPAVERASLLDGLGCVDYVVIFDEVTPEELLRVVQPDVHVKGEEYRGKDIVERRIAEELGFDLVFVDRYYKTSTTEIIKRAAKTLRN
jgi:rfaE bifunctional protein nucleotidyltransferase chain/domain